MVENALNTITAEMSAIIMSSRKMTRRKTFIFACFGIAIGLCIGTIMKNYKALEIVKKCDFRPKIKSPLEVIGMIDNQTIQNSQKNLVFVGVMTAKNFIDKRAKAVYDTWGKNVPGHIAFFSSEGSSSNDIPVIGLKNVDDRYPPQKKSFMMLYYMYEHFVDKFEWFIRADDDVYIEPEKLEKFLRSIDSSKPQFIGQAGKGNSEEFGLLSLEFDENFCMGGPGVVMSAETLRRVAPHIPTCLKNLYSTHEDVEIGRCVQKFAGIPCTWNYEMQYILRHNSSGKAAFTNKLKRREIHNAITLHPIKQGPLMYRLHSYIQGLKAEEIRQESLSLHRDISRMIKLLEIPYESKFLVPGIPLYPNRNDSNKQYEDHDILGVSPDLNKCTPKRTDDLIDWTFIARSLYSADHSNPKRKIDSITKEGLEDTITEVMENINNFSRQRGRIIEFRELLYGYKRLDPLHGEDMILDLLLIYKKYRGKKMTVPVRRHLYVQRSFTGTFIKEFGEDFYNRKYETESLKNIFQAHLRMISKSLTSPGVLRDNSKSKIVFILPISGRIGIFKRFLRIYEEVSIKDGNCDLLIVIFGESHSIEEHLNEIKNIKRRNIYHHINYIHKNESFSRGIALDIAARSSYVQDNDIMLFIDVDLTFSSKTLDRIRMNTIQRKQVYLPIVFSEYNSKSRNNATNNSPEVTNENGYFRQFGYGICAIYKSDMLDPDIDGFDRDITGWGLEDVRFLEKLVKVGNRHNNFLINTANVPDDYNETADNLRKLKIFRGPDPSLIHIYHEINCDPKLESTQYIMCLGTKANTLGSTSYLEELFYKNKENIRFIVDFNEKKFSKKR